MGVKIIALVIVVAFVLSALVAPHLFGTARAKAQGNKVSPHNQRMQCVSVQAGLLCFAGGRDV